MNVCRKRLLCQFANITNNRLNGPAIITKRNYTTGEDKASYRVYMYAHIYHISELHVLIVISECDTPKVEKDAFVRFYHAARL